MEKHIQSKNRESRDITILLALNSKENELLRDLREELRMGSRQEVLRYLITKRADSKEVD